MGLDKQKAVWSELEPYLDVALDLEPSARADWLAQLATTQPGVAQALMQLLSERDALSAVGFMREPVFSGVEDLARSLASGAQIGPYRLIREIGRGGMSSVWLAERSDGQLQRSVAVKLQAGTSLRIERFMRERDILAALTHPNIARLYDAGIASSGQPYLAMEYVTGTSLLESCEQRCCTVQQRLTIFLQILDAVQSAHAQLVIHRDLKPSNILVTPQGRVMLLDFGISKLLPASGIASAGQLTQLAGRALTPQYASPEQIAGEPLGVASDIYSLGVVLYELLTASHPYRLKRDSAAALEEAILREEPLRPSQCTVSSAIAARRRSTPRSLANTLKGDLDTIVLKALKKSPQDRYPSVTALAQDLQNYLHQLPVSARPDSAWYLLGRFAARRRVPLIASAIAAVALVIGAALALWQAREASMQRDRAIAWATRNEAVTEFLETILKEAAASPTPITVTKMLARSEQLALQAQSDLPENRAAVLEMIGQQYFALGDSQAAARLADQALSLLANSSDRALQSRLVCKRALSQSELGESAQAIATITNELRVLASDPENASHCLLNLAEISWTSGTPQAALQHASDALRRYESAARRNSSFGAVLLEAVGYSYHLNGRNDVANEYFERALSKYRELGRERSPAAVTLLGTWAVVMDNAGMPRRALELNDQLLAIEAARDPNIAPPRTLIANRARTLAMLGRFGASREAYDQSCQLAEQQRDTMGRLQCALGLASVSLLASVLTEVPGHLQRADQLLDRDLAPTSPPMILRAAIQARLELAAGHLDSARTLFDRVLATNIISPTTFRSRLGKADIELRLGNLATAGREAEAALQMAKKMQGGLPYSNQTGAAHLMLGRVRQQQNRPAQARAALGEAITHLSNTVDPDHPELLQARRLL